MDQAIVYNTTLMKVNRILDRLEDIGLNVQKYKEREQKKKKRE